jgi:4-deoxy-L-threo-5-hexosulose-uronate ketol-isomerase
MQYTPDIERYRRMTTSEIRSSFLAGELFAASEVRLQFYDLDRVVLGGAVPAGKRLRLDAVPELASEYFTERRELGVLNIGGPGRVTVDGNAFEMANRDGLYVGRGSREIDFESDDPERPARFYLVSYPAHHAYPTVHIRRDDAARVELGRQETANQRVLYKYFHPDGIKSSQLVMGITEVQPGSVWNTMPPHTHTRRSEVYLYFDVPDDAVVFHFMGPPQETRSIVVRNAEAVLSPGWSIHAGAGTAAYTFCWAMGGENQAFDDMQAAELSAMR